MKEREMYDGTLLVRFEEQGHKYRVKDLANGNEWIPGSITGRLNVINKPFLVPWATKLAAETGDKDASKKVMEAAGQRGTDVHNAIEEWLSGVEPKVKKVARAPFNQFLAWQQATNLLPRKEEYLIYSKRYGTAGTLDMLADINGEAYVIDFKTSKSVYPNHAIQVSFYAAALQEEGIVAGAKRGILHLRDKGYTFYTEEMIREKYGSIFECLEAFEGCLAIDKWQKAGKGRK